MSRAFINSLSLVGVILFASQVIASSDDGEEFLARLDGAQEVPPVETGASGKAEFELEHGKIEFELTLKGILGVTAAHIHLGAAGENGPIVAVLFESSHGRNFFWGKIKGELTEEEIIAQDLGFDGTMAALVAKMREGTAYVNVHTVTHPDGKIRGQIHLDEEDDDDGDEDDDHGDEDDDDDDDEDEFEVDLNGAQEVPPVETEASGEAEFEVERRKIEFELELRDIVGVTGAHIHLGAAGANGPIVAFLFDGDRKDFHRGEIEGVLTSEEIIAKEDLDFDGTMGALVARMSEGTAYVNVHTLENPGGEIRGQIRPEDERNPTPPSGTSELSPPDGALFPRARGQVVINPVFLIVKAIRLPRGEYPVLLDDGTGNKVAIGDISILTPDDDDHGDDDEEEFEAELDGAQEVPPVETEASGEAEFELEHGKIEFELELKDIVGVTGAHIHLGATGENGPIVAFLFENADGRDFHRDEIEGELTEDEIIARDDLGFDGTLAALVARMREGTAYVNVHTVVNPGGEIRGQIHTEDDHRTGSGRLKLSGQDLPFEATSPAELQGRPICITTADGVPILTGETPAPILLPEPPDRKVEVEPRLLEFGGVLVDSSRTLEIAVSNTGGLGVIVTSVLFGTETSAEFTITGDPPSGELPVGAVAILRVTYTPVDDGPDDGTIVIQIDDELTVVVGLSGEGVRAGVAKIVIDPSDIAFGQVVIDASRTVGRDAEGKLDRIRNEVEDLIAQQEEDRREVRAGGRLAVD